MNWSKEISMSSWNGTLRSLMMIHDPSHPLWATIKFLALVIGTTFVLWNNASSFDETEVKAILEIAVMAGGYQAVETFVTRKGKDA
jgi:hypothetical protein